MIHPGLLYLGSATGALDAALMQHLGITHILNVADNVPNFFPNHFAYCNLNVRDNGMDAGISRVFGTAYDFYIKCKQAGGACFVHCMSGVNRAPTVTIALLMMDQGMSLKDAHALVKHKRDIINPQPDNVAELQRFEQRLHKNSFIQSC